MPLISLSHDAKGKGEKWWTPTSYEATRSTRIVLFCCEVVGKKGGKILLEYDIISQWMESISNVSKNIIKTWIKLHIIGWMWTTMFGCKYAMPSVQWLSPLRCSQNFVGKNKGEELLRSLTAVGWLPAHKVSQISDWLEFVHSKVSRLLWYKVDNPKPTAIAKPTLCTTCIHLEAPYVHSVGLAIVVGLGWFYLTKNWTMAWTKLSLLRH